MQLKISSVKWCPFCQWGDKLISMPHAKAICIHIFVSISPDTKVWSVLHQGFSFIAVFQSVIFLNSWLPSGAIWWHKSWLTMAQAMAWCCQCWLIISKIKWHSFKGNFHSYQSIKLVWKLLHLNFIQTNQGPTSWYQSHYMHDAYILFYKLIMECLRPDHGRWEIFNSHVAGTLYTLSNTSWGIGTEICEVDIVFPDDPWFGSDTNMNLCVQLYIIHI